MENERVEMITGRYGSLRLAVVGDYCLDRYLEIDPGRVETSIETGLPVHNVMRVRGQPGAAGTILNNLVALGVGAVHPVGFCGSDGEGFELCRALEAMCGVVMDDFFQTDERRTFTYCKPLLIEAGKLPVELNRLDMKNWSPTPDAVQDRLIAGLRRLAPDLDGMILLDQVDVEGSGVVTKRLLAAVEQISCEEPGLFILADSRRGLRGFPSLCYKMNRSELARFSGVAAFEDPGAVEQQAVRLAQRNGWPVVVTLAEEGILGATPDGEVNHVPALPLRGPIDVVGAGDAVTANVTAALASKAGLREALELANVAASLVVHQLGTTGTASLPEIKRLLAVK